MAEVTHPGRYKGPGLADHAVRRADNGCIQFRARCIGTAFKAEGVTRYEDLPEPVEAMAFLNLTRKDGTPIPQQVEALQKALGWDGKSLRALQDGDYTETLISFVVSASEYEGKRRLSVDWINPPPGLMRTEDDDMKVLDAEWQSLPAAPAPAAKVPDTRSSAASPKDEDIPF